MQIGGGGIENMLMNIVLEKNIKKLNKMKRRLSMPLLRF